MSAPNQDASARQMDATGRLGGSQQPAMDGSFSGDDNSSSTATLADTSINADASDDARRQLQIDFIAKRRLVLQEAGIKITGDCDKIPSFAADIHWHGVATWERTLVSFCEQPCLDSKDSVQGALAEDMVLPFLRFVALFCHDAAKRALAFAVLERSLQADKLAEEATRDVAETASMQIDPSDESGTMADAQTHQECLPTEPLLSVPKGGRVRALIAAGGLKLLHQWLIDATTPTRPAHSSVKVAVGNRGVAASEPAKMPSLTSPLLLPLLQFLSNMPFDWKSIEESKLDKLINKLRRFIKKLSDEDTNDTSKKQHIHLLIGDATIESTKEALDRIRSTWKTAYEATSASNAGDKSPSMANDPYAAFRQLLQERRAILENASSNDVDKPEWLIKLQEKAEKVGQKRKRKRLSTAELEKLERAKERSAMLKEDLENAQAYKRQCQAKLRELEKKKLEDKLGGTIHNSRSKNRVRWKDGMSTLTGGRNRVLLEQVFTIAGRKRKGPPPGNHDSVEIDLT